MGAIIDKRSEAIYQLGFILNKWADVNVKEINRSVLDRDVAVITFEDSVRGCTYNREVNIAADSVTEAIKDIIKAVE